MKSRKKLWVASTLAASGGAPSQPIITVSVTPMAICASWAPTSGSASRRVARTCAGQDAAAPARAGKEVSRSFACMTAT